MTNTKLVQIASTMNAVFPNVVGDTTTNELGEEVVDSVVLAEDCSNIVDFGRRVDATYQLGDNFNTYFKKIADKYAEQLLIADEFDLDEEFSITKRSNEVGSIIEMVLFADGEFQDNTSWDEIISGTETAAPTFDDMFGYHPVEAQGEYFNRKVTLESEPYTVTYLQWKSAITSVEKLSEFFARIQERWQNKMTSLRRKLSKMLVCSWIAEKRRRGFSGVFNVLEEYKKRFPTATITAADCFTDGNYLKFQKAFIEIQREMLRERTKLYNPNGYTGAVPKRRQHMLLYAPMAEYMAVWLYSDQYHDDYVKLGGYDTISCWQGVGDGKDDATKMRIAIKTQNSGGDIVTLDGVVGCIFDDRAIFIVDEFPRTVAQDNQFSEWTNYKHKLDTSLFSTVSLNGCVFYVSDYTFAPEVTGLSSAPSNWATVYTNYYTESVDSTTGEITYTAATSTYDDSVEYFKAV